jgi:hypothetical protein
MNTLFLGLDLGSRSCQLVAMNADLVWLRDLPERRSMMRELTARLASRRLAEAAGALDLLPRQLKRRWQA